MTRAQLFDLVGKGYTPFEDTSFKVEQHNVDGFAVATVEVKNINPYTTPASFGGGFADYITDKDCDDLEEAIRHTIEKMKRIEKRANMEPLRFRRIGEKLLKSLDNGRMYGYEECKEGHFSIYTIAYFDRLAQSGEYNCDVCRTVDIDGKMYKPVYSYWLGRTVFLFDSPDGYFPERSEQK